MIGFGEECIWLIVQYNHIVIATLCGGFHGFRTNSILGSKQLEEIKKFIASGAATFGNTLGNITGKISDKLNDALVAAKKKSSDAAVKTGELAHTLKVKASEAMDKTAEVTNHTYVAVKDAGGKVADSTMGTLGRLRSKEPPDR